MGASDRLELQQQGPHRWTALCCRAHAHTFFFRVALTPGCATRFEGQKPSAQSASASNPHEQDSALPFRRSFFRVGLAPSCASLSSANGRSKQQRLESKERGP